MTDSRLAWFAIGASCSAVLFGWQRHRRFSRRTTTVRIRLNDGPTARSNNGPGPWLPKPPIKPKPQSAGFS